MHRTEPWLPFRRIRWLSADLCAARIRFLGSCGVLFGRLSLGRCDLCMLPELSDAGSPGRTPPY